MSGTNASGRKGKTPKRKPTTTPADFTVECPDYLPDTAKAYWGVIVPQLTARGVLTDLDGFSVERLCQLYAEWHMCVAEINENGMFCQHVQDRGSINNAESPAVRRKDKIDAELTKLMGKFGLTPKDREQIKAHKGKRSKSIRDEY